MKRQSFNITRVLFILLIVVIIFHIFNNCFWFSIDKFPMYGDDTFFHIQATLGIAERFTSIRALYNLISKNFYAGYPPFYYFIGAIIHQVDSGRLPFHIIYLTSTLFYSILIIFVYKIGRELFDKETGLLAASIISFYPAIYQHSRYYGDGIVLAAMVSFGIYSLMLTSNFTSIKFSILFGTAIGLGMLTKEIFILFISPPLMWHIIQTSLLNRKVGFRKFANFLLSIFIGCTIALGPYHYRHLILEALGRKDFLLRTCLPDWTAVGERDDIFRFKSFFYFNVIESKLLTPFFTLLFLFSFIFFLFSKVPKNLKVFFLLWILLPIVVLSIFPLKDSRYVLPQLVPIAILTSYGLVRIGPNSTKVIIILLILSFSLIQYYLISFGAFPDFFHFDNKFITEILCPHLKEPPKSNTWFDSYTVFLKHYTDKERQNKTILIFCYKEPHFHSIHPFFCYLQDYIKLNHLNINFVPFFYPDNCNVENFLNTLGKADMFICLSHEPDLIQSISKWEVEVQNFAPPLEHDRRHVADTLKTTKGEKERLFKAFSNFKLVKRNIATDGFDCDAFIYIFKRH